MIDEISARNFVRAIGEFNLPPIRFEDVGTPTFFLQSLRPELHGRRTIAVTVADDGRQRRRIPDRPV